ncbi:MAG: hypothetical protein IPN53_25185 [Comamonadaceae bacterium]|nr:hypothetical protein [Comamonadaceae bacterium]
MIAANENGLDSREVNPSKLPKTPADDKLKTSVWQPSQHKWRWLAHVVHKLETGFLVSRWGQTKGLP